MKDLIINKEFKRLSLKRNDEHIQKLKESILLRGYIRPLPVWRGILLDSFDRYAICTENGVSFEVSEMNFDNRNEAIE